MFSSFWSDITPRWWGQFIDALCMMAFVGGIYGCVRLVLDVVMWFS